jgi:hypothetical protein
MSGNRGAARLKRVALRLGGRNTGFDCAVDRRLCKFDRQRRRRRRQRVTDRSRRHTDRTEIVNMAISGMARAPVAIGRRSRGGKPQKAVLGAGSIKGVEMTERQCKLDHQRKERDPGNAFDVRPNPCHAGTRPTSKGLRIKPLSRLPQVSRSWLNGVNDVASKCRQNSAICGIFATPHQIGGGEPIAKPARLPSAGTRG